MYAHTKTNEKASLDLSIASCERQQQQQFFLKMVYVLVYAHIKSLHLKMSSDFQDQNCVNVFVTFNLWFRFVA